MNLLQLQYFRTIARYENISRAAEVLCVAQPNLSSGMKRLEEELGVALFDRRRGKIRLTRSGRLFLTHVEQVLDRLDEGITEVRAAEKVADEQLRVVSGIVDLMGLLLAEFLPDSNGVSFHQIGSANDAVAGRVLRGEADLGFLFGPCAEETLEYIPLDTCERVVMVSSVHPLAGKDVVSLRDLAGEKLLCNRARDDEALLEDLTRQTGFRLRPFFECDDNRAEIGMLLAGGGVSITPLSNYLKLLHNDPSLPLTCRRLREEIPAATIGMIRRTGDHLSDPALRFYQIVAAFFEKERAEAARYAELLPTREE